MMQGRSNKAISRILASSRPEPREASRNALQFSKALKVENRMEAVITVGSLGWELPQIAGAVGCRCDRGTPVLCSAFSLALQGTTLTTERSVIGSAPASAWQIISARPLLRAALGRGIAADEEGRDQGTERATYALYDVEASFSVLK
jgi:hypothetical protein